MIPDSSLSACADPVLIVTGDGTVLWSNSAFQNLSAGRKLTEFFGTAALGSLLSTEHYGCYDITLLHNNGKELKQTAVVIAISSGDPDSTSLLLTLKSTPSELSRVAEREQYLAAIAHDLRNPLSAIFSYADALVDTSAGDGILPPQRQILKRIRSTSARCVELIRNYQLLAQLQTKGFLRPNIAHDLNEIARTVVDGTWREDIAGPTLTCDLNKKPLPVFMEKVQIERAIANLVTNALKFTPTKGRILLKTFEAGKWNAISVNNTEVQIAEDELPTLFNRYTRTASSKGIGGSGLGLFIVKTLIEAGGGKVEAKSSAKDGVTVSLYFPRSL